jgi:nucleotide-binding universal stress UspA family protein
LRETGPEVTPIINGDGPRRVILQEAEGWEADSIFVGTSDKGRVERWLRGGVSTAVVTRAHPQHHVVEA